MGIDDALKRATTAGAIAHGRLLIMLRADIQIQTVKKVPTTKRSCPSAASYRLECLYGFSDAHGARAERTGLPARRHQNRIGAVAAHHAVEQVDRRGNLARRQVLFGRQRLAQLGTSVVVEQGMLALGHGKLGERILHRAVAFFSYSHRDKAWGEWLHRSLEAYRIDRDLVGRETPVGPVPQTLQPIFRDREDFSAGHSLTAQTLAALESSQFLLVVCSPRAAASTYVDEEIRRFKATGRSEFVIPIVVDGAPGDPARECFPAALRFKVSAGGTLTQDREEPIAADAREEGDGKEIARHKVIAGLLGVRTAANGWCATDICRSARS
jgi:hypothetical protein